MAKKKSGSKKSSRKSVRRPSRTAAGKIKVTGSSITINLDAATRKQMKECLAKSGKITFSIREHSFTKLPAILENGKLID